jgi:hypothetical protein
MVSLSGASHKKIRCHIFGVTCLVVNFEKLRFTLLREVEPRGFEPLTSSMPLRRSTN